MNNNTIPAKHRVCEHDGIVFPLFVGHGMPRVTVKLSHSELLEEKPLPSIIVIDPFVSPIPVERALVVLG